MFLKSGWVVATLFLGSKLEHGPKLEMKQQQKHGEPEMEEIFNSQEIPLGGSPPKKDAYNSGKLAEKSRDAWGISKDTA